MKKQKDMGLNGKTVLITGSTGGIGREMATHFTRQGASLIFANRSEEKTHDLTQEILRRHPNAQIKFVPLDLLDGESVNNFLRAVSDMQVDFFVHNAGIYNVPRHTTELGFDNVYQTNCLMPYYITKALLPKFKKQHTKVLYMGSIAYNYGKINFDDIQAANLKKVNLIYGNSKRIGMFALSELMRRNEDVPFSIIHPGLTLTQMTNHYPKAVNWLVRVGLKIACPSPKKASLCALYATHLSTDFGEWIGPKTFNIWGKPKVSKFKIDSAESEKAFEMLEQQSNELALKLKATKNK